MNDEHFKQFLKELDEAPDYVKENTMCYFWHNTSACTQCTKKDCKAREPRELPPKITNLERIDPNEKGRIPSKDLRLLHYRNTKP